MLFSELVPYVTLTKGDIITLVSVGIPALVALVVGLKGSKSNAMSGQAAQYSALSARLKDVEERLDRSESREGKLVQYIYILWGILTRSDIPIPPPPPDIMGALPDMIDAIQDGESQ